MSTPTIYVITYYKFNHEDRQRQIDDRFLKSDRNFVYYLIDKQVPDVLKSKNTLREYEIDKEIYEAGGKYFGEWSFLLAEAKYGFCTYPFFMVSSRFYEKNEWIYRDLSEEWETLFGFFANYGCGFLPSYDRPLRWIDMKVPRYQKERFQKYFFYPFHPKTFELTESLFNVKVPQEYRYTSDLFCNYIGFKNRQQLLNYVNFYRPVLDELFDERYVPKENLDEYVRKTGSFRCEKPFTFYLELFSHLYFYKTHQKFFTLHYDGYYEVDEKEKRFTKLKSYPIPIQLQTKRFLDWQKRRLISETRLRPFLLWLQPKVRTLKSLVR